MKYDIVIKSHPKDYSKLPYVIDSLDNLNPMFENIYLVSPDGFIPSSNFTDIIIPIKDSEALPKIDKSKINYRYNWCWVNMLSITQEFTENDLYFDVQADNVFLKPLDLFTDDGRPRLFKTKSNSNNNNRWGPYFNFSEKMYSLEKVTLGSSYIIEFMMYDKKKLSYLYKNYENKESMIEEAYNNINDSSYPADQEIYGNLIEKVFPEDYEIINPIETHLGGKFSNDDESLKEFLDYIDLIKSEYPDAVACSHHTYWLPE